MRNFLALGFVVIELFRFFQGVKHLQLAVYQNCGGGCKSFEGLCLVRDNDNCCCPQTFAQNFARFAVEFYVRAVGHALIDEVHVEIERKSDKTPVTLADQNAEKRIREILAERYPEHGIIGEEYGRERDDADFVWVLESMPFVAKERL